ncbi:MAG: hypothetical protein UU86_C0050G0003 [candidate division WWE3 bacterium GW2011_GWC1_42_102]|nr:MAG: hypothetical protein UU86_C0050G0003 [candidate division WWE3 bacterium GW2011_GWC1_42_102]
MLGRKSKSKSSSTHPIARFIRSVLSVVVLTALVLGITLGAKELYAGRPDGDSDKNVYAGKDVAVEIAFLSDIHDDVANLNVALNKVKERGIKDVFILGDITGYGDVTSLTKIKDILDGSGVEYFVIPGDHDLAQSLDTGNFTSVFGREYGETDISGYNFVYFNNSANFTVIAPSAISWIEQELPEADFFLVSQPLYTEELAPPFNRIFMGSTNGEVTDASMLDKQDAVRSQGELFLSLVRNTASVKALIAGDHHKSSSLTDPVRSSLMHYVVGAVSSSLNDYPQKALQSSRFGVLTIFQDGSYEVSDVVLD